MADETVRNKVEPTYHLTLAELNTIRMLTADVKNPALRMQVTQIVEMAELQPVLSTVQSWVHRLPRMQQAVLLVALRGPDGVAKDHPSKYLVRWLRRCVLVTAFERTIYTDPYELGGGDFTGPAPADTDIAGLFFKEIDSLPFHFVTHMIAAAQIVAYQHTDALIKCFWLAVYSKWCKKIHVRAEALEDMNKRLGDREADWRKGE